jgi:hypothetical protein
MSLRIAFDLDGVLANLDGALIRHSTALFGAQERAGGGSPGDAQDVDGARPAAAPSTAAPDWPFAHRREVWRHVSTIENFWEQLDEVEPGATARLAVLAAERQWEIIFLTKRHQTAGATAQLQSQRWLERMGFAHASVFVVRRSRGAIAAALGLDALVDDSSENCVDVAVDSSAHAILVARSPEAMPAAARRMGIRVVRSVEESLLLLTELDTARTHRPRLLQRLIHLMTLNPQPAA